MSEGFRIGLDDGVATLTFARPDKGNAISPEMTPGLTGFFEEARTDPAVRCVVVRGDGKHFSSGGDIAGFAEALRDGPAAIRRQFDERLTAAGKLAEAVIAFDRPIVASVRGAVAGAGLLFVLAADIVLADETATMLFSHLRIGLTPDAGVSWLLPRVVGRRAASRLVLTAAKVDAAEGLALGLISSVVASDELDDETRRLATRLARSSQAAISGAKQLLAASPERSAAEQLDAERRCIVDCVGEPDFAEGVNAFLEKRRAQFL